MHPADRKYFTAYAREAENLGLSLEDYYLRVQKETHSRQFNSTYQLRPDQKPSMHHVLPFIGKDATCLVVGCGTGAELRFLREQGIENLAGLDISEERLAYCRKTYGVDIVYADMRKTGLPNRFYDVVLARQSLHHLFYPFQALEEMARLARKNVILVSEPCRTPVKRVRRWLTQPPEIGKANCYEYQFDIADVHRYMAFNGFELVTCKRTSESRIHPLLAKLLRFVPGGPNRFTAVYQRFDL